MKVGDFNQEELYKCMAMEPRAEGVFYKGTVDLTRAMANEDPDLAMKAFDTFIAFIVDMATEHVGKSWKEKLCPTMTAHPEKLINIGIMIKELMNKDLTLKYDKKNEKVMFNN